MEFLIAGEEKNMTVNFTGYMNMILLNDQPQPPLEMLSNAFKSPSSEANYEPFLIVALIIKDENTTEFANTFYDYGSISWKYDYNSSSSTLPSAADLPSDKISVCEFHVVNVRSYL
jgi:hypothetical protein